MNKKSSLWKTMQLLSGWDCAMVYVNKSFTVQMYEKDFLAFMHKNHQMPKKMMKSNLFDILPQLSPYMQEFQEVLKKKKERVIEDQFDFDGDALSLKIRVKYWEERNAPALIIQITDKTEQKRLHKEREDRNEEIKMVLEELKIKNDQLTQANESKDKLFSILGHDFRTVFNWIKGLTDLLKNNANSNEKRTKYLDMLSDSTNTGFEMFESLLAWSRSGDMNPCPSEEYLLTHVNDVISLLAPYAERKGILLQAGAESLHANVFADANMLDAILRNLISNAIKFTDIGGSISIDAHESENYFRVCVTDTGVGIAPENLKTLLNLDGFRSYGTKNERGTGLGLVTCKSFIEKNGGTMDITSEVGKGSIFCFTIPKKN